MPPMPTVCQAGPRAPCPSTLKPRCRPKQNARKWYAPVELERLSPDPVWLDRATRIVDRLVREANGDKKGKEFEETLAA